MVCMWSNTGMPLTIPEDYYVEGLRRDPTDIRLNNAYGRCLLKKCDFAGAEKYSGRRWRSLSVPIRTLMIMSRTIIWDFL